MVATWSADAVEPLAVGVAAPVRINVQGSELRLTRGLLSRLIGRQSVLAVSLREVSPQPWTGSFGSVPVRVGPSCLELSGRGAVLLGCALHARGSAGETALPRARSAVLFEGYRSVRGDLFIGQGGVAFAPTEAGRARLWSPVEISGALVVDGRLQLECDDPVSVLVDDPADALRSLAASLALTPRSLPEAPGDALPYEAVLVRNVVWWKADRGVQRAWVYAGRDGVMVKAGERVLLDAKSQMLRMDVRTDAEVANREAILLYEHSRHHLLPVGAPLDLSRRLLQVIGSRMYGTDGDLGPGWSAAAGVWDSVRLHAGSTEFTVLRDCEISLAEGVLRLALDAPSRLGHGESVEVELCQDRKRYGFRAQVAGGGYFGRTSDDDGRSGLYLELRPLGERMERLSNRRELVRLELADIDLEVEPLSLVAAGRSVTAHVLDVSGAGSRIRVPAGTPIEVGTVVQLRGLQRLLPGAPEALDAEAVHIRPLGSGSVALGLRFSGLRGGLMDRMHAAVQQLIARSRLR